MKPYWFHPEALAGADDTAAFYKERQPELGARFLEALNDAVARIRRKPLMYPRIEGEIKEMPSNAISL